MPRRFQMMMPDEEYDRLAQLVPYGIRARVVKNLITRAAEAVEDSGSNISLDTLIRGDFKVEDFDHGNF